MNDTIRVGDRVETLKTHRTGCVSSIYGDKAWVLLDSGELDTVYLDVLTRIEPEKAVLTPKYAVGEEVQSYVVGIKKARWTVVEARVDYLVKLPDGTLDHRVEFQLEPAPEPCPKCKGSGKASE